MLAYVSFKVFDHYWSERVKRTDEGFHGNIPDMMVPVESIFCEEYYDTICNHSNLSNESINLSQSALCRYTTNEHNMRTSSQPNQL
jgi:hypothetical protein